MIQWARNKLRRRQKRKEYRRFWTKMAKVYVATKHSGWADFFSTTASTAALGVGNRKAANLSLHTTYSVPDLMNNIELRFRGSAGEEDRTATAHVYMARRDDDICHIGDVAITVGAQVATDGSLYIDTMTLTDRWITEVKVADGNGNNGMSRIALDASGYDIIFLLIEYAGGSMTWSVDIAGF